MTIVLFARSLEIGGADRQLVLLARELVARGHRIVVVLYYGGGPLQKDLEGAGIEVEVLGKRGRWHVVGFLARLLARLRAIKADLYHGYLPGPNLLLALLCPLLPGRVLFGVRGTSRASAEYDWVEALVRAVELRLAKYVSGVIANSDAGAGAYRLAGVPDNHVFVIPNGVDTNYFKPDPDARVRGRRTLGIAETDQLIGLIARLDPIKDHFTFLTAAAKLASQRPCLYFACVGPGPMEAKLRSQSAALGLGERVIWTGQVADIVAIYNACDVVALTSKSEGFPNAIAEAMGCGVPCVVTDVGDCKTLVAETGRVIAIGDSHGLASALIELLDLPAEHRRSLGLAARARIEANYDTNTLAERTLAVFQRIRAVYFKERM